MSGMVRLLQNTTLHPNGTMITVVDGKIQPRGPNRITVEDANDLISRGIAEWVAMPAALQEQRLIALESLTSEIKAAHGEMQRRLEEQTRQIAELQHLASLKTS
jgi:hypothetical protein